MLDSNSLYVYDEDGNEKGADCCNTSHHQRSNNHHTLRDVLQGDTEGYPPLRCSSAEQTLTPAAMPSGSLCRAIAITKSIT